MWINLFLVQAFAESGIILLKSNDKLIDWCGAKLLLVKQNLACCCRSPIEVPSNSGSANSEEARRRHTLAHVLTHKTQILTNLAQQSHNQWNADYHLANDTTESIAECFKEENGEEINIAVPFDELHPLRRNKQIAGQAEYLLQLRPMMDDAENVLGMPDEELVTILATKIHDVWMTNEAWCKDQGSDLHLFVPFNELDAVEQKKDLDMARIIMPILWSLDSKSDSLEEDNLAFSNRHWNGSATETKVLAQAVQVELAMTLKIYLMVMPLGMCITRFNIIW